MARTSLAHLAPPPPEPVSGHPSANNAFIAACLDFDDLISRLQAVRAAHFGVEPDADWRNWADVGSVAEVNRRLASALAFITGTGSEPMADDLIVHSESAPFAPAWSARSWSMWFLYANGRPQIEIARIFGISRQRVSEVILRCKRNYTPKDPLPPEIAARFAHVEITHDPEMTP